MSIFYYIPPISSYKDLISRKRIYFLISWIYVGIKLGPSFSAAGHTLASTRRIKINNKRKWVCCVFRISSSMYVHLLQHLIDNSVFVVVVSGPIEGKVSPSYSFLCYYSTTLIQRYISRQLLHTCLFVRNLLSLWIQLNIMFSRRFNSMITSTSATSGIWIAFHSGVPVFISAVLVGIRAV